MHNKIALINRLKSAVGHLNGIIAMVEEDRYCIEVIKQIQAVQAALAKVNHLILDDHLRNCMITAVRGEDAAERERALNEISELFAQMSR
ncbi:MAG: transcriptional regulator [Candidatus Thermofonsia Clade 1 bacterium]|jgi:DNA-binding FrmR family transcriptional regulator|uniref:Transcriptional regulator n=2 Tax=Candidatus Thermofonsia Clade 1 bacterium TaxID=2364210 RepID=A0A2M8PBS2_9CHLR|nr:MAG: transcriptional regulator [Candidatus Thermofonsia Clade 1 bacterium]RMF52422.1 MAG: transcriptional regulator [Chloroflexota bacterium]